ncbi:MAG: VOC family protein [Steroidobacteraceae bacterium]
MDKLGAFLEQNGMTVLDPPGEYYGRNYYAVYFVDPDGMKLEGMIWAPPKKPEKAKRRQAARKKAQARKSRS